MSAPHAAQPKSNFTADPCFKLRQSSLDCLADNGGQPAACKEFVEYAFCFFVLKNFAANFLAVFEFEACNPKSGLLIPSSALIYNSYF